MSKNIPMIPTSLPYVGVGRNFLTPDLLEKGEVAEYWRDVAARSYVIPRRGVVPDAYLEPEEEIAPTIGLGIAPRMSRDDIDKCPYDLVERTYIRAEDSLERLIDVEIFKVLNAAIEQDHMIESIDGVSIEMFLEAKAMIEKHDLLCKNILMHPLMFAKIRAWQHPDITFFSDAEWKISGKRGVFFESDIYVSVMAPKNTVYFAAPKEFVGVLPIEYEKQIEEYLDSPRNRVGRTYRSKMGFMVIQAYALSRICCTSGYKIHTSSNDTNNNSYKIDSTGKIEPSQNRFNDDYIDGNYVGGDKPT